MVSQNHQQQMAALSLLQQQQQQPAPTATAAPASAAAAQPAQPAGESAAAGQAVSGSQPVFDQVKFWAEQQQLAESFDSDFKNHPLPLARIKKVMKSDQDVKVGEWGRIRKGYIMEDNECEEVCHLH